MGRLISRKEAAVILGVTEQTISNWAVGGVLKTHNVRINGKGMTMVDSKTVHALIDDAKAIEESKERLEEMRLQVEREEKEFLFKKFIKSGLKFDESAYIVIQELALDFIKFATEPFEDEKRRKVLDMFIQGFSIGDIANEFGLTRTRVRQLLFSCARILSKVGSFKEIYDKNNELKARNSELQQSYELALRKLKGKESELKELKYKLGIEDAQKIMEIDDKELAHKIKLFNTAITDTTLSVRALNCLKAADVETLGDLVQFNKTDLLKFRNFGRKTMIEIDDYLNSLNLSFGTDVETFFRTYNEKIKDLVKKY